MMKTSERPPLKQKKGIRIVQSPQSHNRPQCFKQSGTGSMTSTSRSRGISISRETGITMDKIYEAKHFLPPKPTPQEISKKSEAEELKTLTSVRSLKLISVFADSTVQGPNPSGQSSGVKGLQSNEGAIVKRGQFDNRCNSPILKLNGTEEQESEKGSRPTPFLHNVLKF